MLFLALKNSSKVIYWVDEISLFVAILETPGISDQIVGSIILIIFTNPMNTIEKIIYMNPILDKMIPALSLSVKYLKQIEKKLLQW